MTTDMDVDSVENEIASISLHPLTIVTMSDQFTRMTCGGSPLPAGSPVVGLLFGRVDESKVLQIGDADDIPTTITEATKVQVDLHRAVFPQHCVVGWYRVTEADEEPTSSDLHITQMLKQHYAQSAPFCFCLLHVLEPNSKLPASKSTVQEELPISLYELHDAEGKSVLLGISNWSLETSEPERIAVERVMKEHPHNSPKMSLYSEQMTNMHESLSSMRERIQILAKFLEQTRNGAIPVNYRLIRRVDALLMSLGPLHSFSGTETQSSAQSLGTEMQLLLNLAAVSKTVNAVESYTGKFRIVHESSIGKEMRRAF